MVEIPAELKDEANKHRAAMIEAVAEMDDELTHKYLEGKDLTVEDIKRGLRLGTLSTRIIPVLTGSALKNKGVQQMLDAVVDYLPVAARRAADDRRSTRAPARNRSGRRATTSRSARSPSRSPPTRSSASCASSVSTRAR